METTLTLVESKRLRGKARYEARYQRIGDNLAKKKRTRASDIATRRTGDGIPPCHEARVTNRRANRIELTGLLPSLFKRDSDG